MNRSKNSIRNILFGVGGQILNILMSFAYRTVFMHTLSDEYLGINGVFTNILMVFSLADLGVVRRLSLHCTNRSPKTM